MYFEALKNILKRRKTYETRPRSVIISIRPSSLRCRTLSTGKTLMAVFARGERVVEICILESSNPESLDLVLINIHWRTWNWPQRIERHYRVYSSKINHDYSLLALCTDRFIKPFKQYTGKWAICCGTMVTVITITLLIRKGFFDRVNYRLSIIRDFDRCRSMIITVWWSIWNNCELDVIGWLIDTEGY